MSADAPQNITALLPHRVSEAKSLLDTAFAPSSFESALVQKLLLRTDSHLWILEETSRLVGVVAYSPAYRNGVAIGYHLAPIAVHPTQQRLGFGSKLIHETLAMPPIDASPVFVLGDPSYYERFGFGSAQDVQCPYDPTGEHFRALRWPSGKESFVIGYPSEFTMCE
ncbi:GNAT family N-acetyltransferase [Cerasicoccus frondis]|uniref:GNAT family N-acetyltransferase n=1 Tax=Cerasicoccus frondis TaxID=490090 RepID=UPI002852A944|nr:GNAT family N-acetyltransferase [Cerasicoccus frondis]